MRKARIRGITNGITAAISYGTNPLFAMPMIERGIGVNSILFYRYFLAVLIYGIYLKFCKKISLSLNAKEFIPLFILAMLFSFSSITLFSAFKYIDVGIACTILFIYPTIVAIISSIFFREKLSKTVIFAILITTIGILLLSKTDPGSGLNTKGIILSLSSALLYALYMVGVKEIKIIRHIKPDKLNFYVMFFGLSVYIINLKLCTELQMLTSPFLWICAVFLAIIPTIISLETITIAIKLIGATKTAVLGALEPITAICVGVIFFNEILTLKIFAGILLVFTGVLLIISKK